MVGQQADGIELIVAEQVGFLDDHDGATETVIGNTRDVGIGQLVTADNWKALRAVSPSANQRLCDAQASDARTALDAVTLTQLTHASQFDGQHAPGLPFWGPRLMAVFAAVIGFTRVLRRNSPARRQLDRHRNQIHKHTALTAA